MGLYPVAVVMQLDTSHKITHHTQTKHSTQNYKNNEGHILHTINTITIQIQLQIQYRGNRGAGPVILNLGARWR
jgi:hypothetical protein